MSQSSQGVADMVVSIDIGSVVRYTHARHALHPSPKRRKFLAASVAASYRSHPSPPESATASPTPEAAAQSMFGERRSLGGGGAGSVYAAARSAGGGSGRRREGVAALMAHEAASMRNLQAMDASPSSVAAAVSLVERDAIAREMAVGMAALSMAAPEAVFSPWKLAAVFDQFADPLDSTVIGPEGVYELCQALGWNVESVHLLALAWIVNAALMGYFAQDEWMTLSQHDVASLDSLNTFVNSIVERVAGDDDSLRALYRYAFEYMTRPGQKSVSKDMACSMWRLLLAPGAGESGLLDAFEAFLHSPACSYRVINADQWALFVDFYELLSTAASIDDVYSADSAWPVLFDEFVAWMRESA
ncbi:uncharacterized protein AMSG_11222 [Thecamonas trahens ATCC 50062]|uniref:Defective in cullin neddylation protein n=1 Tax=Thecamonas trahens ATCC 50062 TaxID=461836 RepID=A0A0L0DW89_THETB|nr:hypothetical protein AMSG_11222 [Thecamonas trahens ATCC 50062]KNC55788.1 hypothetical protein AMSG_11222 [Thecamonas trahens ATCC 50062]|eukprot:XP_013752870.1 hypothetical protein AMSG_11222 [Thecamonas trahens ATCC 50062]